MTWKRPCSRIGWVLTGVVGAWSMVGCQSPTLPLPPPDLPGIAQLTAPNQVTVAGSSVLAGALVMMFNLETNSGTIVTADSFGRYIGVVPVDLTVHPTNGLLLWQRYGIDDSSATEVEIPYGPEHPQLDRDASATDATPPADGADVIEEDDGKDSGGE